MFQVPEIGGAEDRSGQTVQKKISSIMAVDNVYVNKLSLDDIALPAYAPFGDFFESKDQLFVFSKALVIDATS
jgi:hypothetical protein